MMKHTLKFILIGLLCCLCNFTVQAQTRNRQYEEYIHKYKDLAVDEMKRYRIPGMMMMPVMNVFVPISTLVSHMKIILNF